MPDLSAIAWLIPILPLLGGLVAFLGGRWLRELVAWPVVAGIALAFLIALGLLLGSHEPTNVIGYRWLPILDLEVPIQFQLSGLTTMMLAMITFVASFIALFAKGYMAGDSGAPRFFFLIGLFVFSMTGLVLSSHFLLTYAFWEGVGVCSYLLIGYYHAKPSAALAAQKAFLVNRVGDFGFAVAIFWLWSVMPNHALDYATVLNAETLASLDGGAKAGIALLLFWAATAKSAQIPLYTWLPDAMEGPTPVSALIHAATMVTAGVYLVARSSALFIAVPGVQLTIAVIGCLTALVSALIALTQTDLKRVLAYSTVSQLGFMFMALGSALGGAWQFAVVAAVFHLFTHAFFKALLFLGSGSVMHSMGNVIDMRRFGGLCMRMPVTCLTFAVGALGLAGLPPLAGFFSKDEILASIHLAKAEASVSLGAGWAWLYDVIYCLALFTALLTAYYIGRAFILTFLGPEKLPSPTDPEADPHEQESHGHGHGHGDEHGHEIGHESPGVMTIPLIVLAVGTVLVGLAFGPTGLFAHHIETTPGFAAVGEAHAHATDWMSVGLGTTMGVVGLLAAFVIHGGRAAEPQPNRPGWFVALCGIAKPVGQALGALGGVLRPVGRALGPVRDAAAAKFKVDEFYTAFLIQPTRMLSRILAFLDDSILEPLVRGIALLPRLFGREALATSQNGLIQFYAAVTALGVGGLLLVVLLTS